MENLLTYHICNMENLLTSHICNVENLHTFHICNMENLLTSHICNVENLLENVPRTLPSSFAATESQSLTAISAATFFPEEKQ